MDLAAHKSISHRGQSEPPVPPPDDLLHYLLCTDAHLFAVNGGRA